MYIHISKKGINISLHINLNVLRKFMILCWATLIAVLGRTRRAGHLLDSSDLEHTKNEPKLQKYEILKKKMFPLNVLSLYEFVDGGLSEY